MGEWEVVLVDLTVEAHSGVRVGGPGGANFATDAPLLRDPRGRPLIPGSSLKGVLRSAAERLLRGVAADGQLPGPKPPVCDVLQKPCGGPLRSDAELVPPEALCHVCRLFGSPHLGGRLFVGDLVSDDAATVIRDGVAIDRDELRVSGPRKYDYEVVVPGTRFSGRLRVDDPRPGDLGVLATLLDLLDAGVVTVGGGASRGLGRLKVVPPVAATRLVASIWAPSTEPERFDLGARRGEVRAILEEARA